MKYIAAIIFIIAAVLIAGYIDKPMTPMEKTLAVCNKAHTEASGFSENYCGQLQDENNLLFVCDNTESEDNRITNAMVDRGELPESSRENKPQCWLEKGGDNE